MVAADGCVVAGVVLTAVAVVVAIVYGTWQVAQASQARKDREADRIAGDTARAEERAAAEEERKGLARAVLDATIIALSGELHPAPAGVALARAAVDVRAENANVWVHEVQLSWGYPRDILTGAEQPWQAVRASCPPWRDDQLLPLLLQAGARALEFGWPGDQPSHQGGLTYEVRARCSVVTRRKGGEASP